VELWGIAGVGVERVGVDLVGVGLGRVLCRLWEQSSALGSVGADEVPVLIRFR
jgi:hypothetical protein